MLYNEKGEPIKPNADKIESQLDEIKEKYNLKDLCKDLNDVIKKEKNKNGFNFRCLLSSLRKHWREKLENSEDNASLLSQYHVLVKLALRSRFSVNGVKRIKSSASNDQSFTLDECQLHKLVCFIAKNKITGHLIKNGRIIHYQNCRDPQYIEKSQGWTSEGQTQMKQMEALVQQWYIACSFAQRNLTRIIYPDGLEKNGEPIDLFVKKGWEIAKKKIEESPEEVKKRLSLIYNPDPLFSHSGNDCERIVDFIRYIKCFAAKLRHNMFHFHQGKSLVENLKTREASCYTKEYIKKGLQEYAERTKKKLKTIQCVKFYGKEELEIIVPLLQKGNHGENLPKFSRLVRRYTDAWKKNNSIKFITQHQKHEMKSNQFLVCRYELLKWLYERQDFACDLNSHKMNVFCEEAKKRAAKDCSNKTELIPRMNKIRNIKPDESIDEYMNFLQGETARYFTMKSRKNQYESNPERGREYASFIEKFRQDIVLQAFASYIENKKLCFLLKAKSEDENNEDKGDNIIDDLLKEPQSDKKLEKSLESYSTLYLYCHLVPIDQLNNLLHQMIKSTVCFGKSSSKDSSKSEIINQLKEVKSVLHFYSTMHDLNYSGGTIQELSKNGFEDFYECRVLEKLRNINPENPEKNENDILPLRDLKELKRFGNISFIKKYITQKVSNCDWENYIQKKSNIQEVEKYLQVVHEDWAAGKKAPSCKDYKEQLQERTAYKEIRAKCLLQEHKRFYQIAVILYARLLGYVFKWERYMYCISLALGGDILSPEDRLEPVDLCLGMEWIGEESSKNSKKIRNTMFHFNKFDNLDPTQNTDMISLINEIRELMSYDRNLKNSVSQAVKRVFFQQGFDIKFSMESHGRHDLRLDKISPIRIKHLSKGKNSYKGIEEPKNSLVLANSLAVLLDSAKKQVN